MVTTGGRVTELLVLCLILKLDRGVRGEESQFDAVVVLTCRSEPSIFSLIGFRRMQLPSHLARQTAGYI